MFPGFVNVAEFTIFNQEKGKSFAAQDSHQTGLSVIKTDCVQDNSACAITAQTQTANHYWFIFNISQDFLFFCICFEFFFNVIVLDEEQYLVGRVVTAMRQFLCMKRECDVKNLSSAIN